jgi:hypothetical protein
MLMSRPGGILLLTLVVLATTACDVVSATPTARPTATPGTAARGPLKYAGSVGGTRTFAGIVADGESAAALVTDGTESVSVFAWFGGPVKDSAFTATSNNITLSARIGGDAASGTLTMPDGRVLNIVLPRVRGGAGVYRAESNSTGQPYTAGWVVLPTGEQRAAAAYGTGDVGRVVAILPLDFDPGGQPTTVEVPGVGRFQPEPLLP